MLLIYKLNSLVFHMEQDMVARYKNLSISAFSQALSL